MRIIYLSEEKEIQGFAQRAARYFEENPQHRSYSDREINPGCLLAMKWGRWDNCVLVLKLDDFFEPINYQNLIHKKA